MKCCVSFFLVDVWGCNSKYILVWRAKTKHNAFFAIKCGGMPCLDKYFRKVNMLMNHTTKWQQKRKHDRSPLNQQQGLVKELNITCKFLSKTVLSSIHILHASLLGQLPSLCTGNC